MTHKVLIGVLSYNDLHYLKESLPVVESLRQNLPADVIVLDTAHNDEVQKFLEKEFPDFDYVRHEEGNIGYGNAYNEMLRLKPGHEFFLVYTSDVLLHEPTVKSYVKRMHKDKDLVMCAGKMHFWDFEEKRKTQLIDTLGIIGEKRHHFHELGSGERDEGQYDKKLDSVFGISGAAYLLRTSAVWDLHGNNWQIYDDRMWMYKEDVDLAYRFRWLGKKIKVFPEVWGWHARTVANREGQSTAALARADVSKPAYGRMHSYQNHLLMLKNNFTFTLGLGVILRTLIYEKLKAIFMLFRHPKVFLSGLKTLLFVPAQRSDRRVSAQTIRNLLR
ncbi:MAG: GT2 family glycosyltransferase [Oceanicoccus sp.]|jgi:GT2 family glycosyltransferase